MTDCIFCKIVKGEVPSGIRIYENDNFFSIPDTNPCTGGHSLVIAKKHFETTLDMPNTLGIGLLDCIKKTILKVMDKRKATGCNVVANYFESAGQIVKHVHFHIIPRIEGDGVKLGI